MWTEYALKQDSRYMTYVYGFAPWEKRVLLSGIPSHIRKLEKRIDQIENNPKNEGQVTFDDMQREIQLQINSLKEIQKEFEKDIELYNRDKPNHLQV
jgi:glutathionyl-hydroquinone reductase